MERVNVLADEADDSEVARTRIHSGNHASRRVMRITWRRQLAPYVNRFCCEIQFPYVFQSCTLQGLLVLKSAFVGATQTFQVQPSIQPIMKDKVDGRLVCSRFQIHLGRHTWRRT
jgi:hypothetical protein